MVRERLLGLAQNVRQTARQVFAHRGKYGPRAQKLEYERPWKSSKRSDRIIYRVDRKHPLVAAVLDEASNTDAAEAMLRVLEETIPVQQIWLNSSEEPEHTAAPFEGASARERRIVISVTYQAIRRNRMLSREETLDLLRSQEEFSDEESHAIIATLDEDSTA
tara:strand:- start:81 stop:569 length:489 start_codon:yes stop_codon:yes gene_type:complete